MLLPVGMLVLQVVLEVLLLEGFQLLVLPLSVCGGPVGLAGLLALPPPPLVQLLLMLLLPLLVVVVRQA